MKHPLYRHDQPHAYPPYLLNEIEGFEASITSHKASADEEGRLVQSIENFWHDTIVALVDYHLQRRKSVENKI